MFLSVIDIFNPLTVSSVRSRTNARRSDRTIEHLFKAFEAAYGGEPSLP